MGYFPFAISRKRTHFGNMSHSRYGLSHCWHQIIVLRLMQNEARQMALTAREESAVDEALKRFAAECLYQASLQGWNSYRDFKKFVDDVEMTTAKNLVRAIYSTVRLLLRRSVTRA